MKHETFCTHAHKHTHTHTHARTHTWPPCQNSVSQGEKLGGSVGVFMGFIIAVCCFNSKFLTWCHWFQPISCELSLVSEISEMRSQREQHLWCTCRHNCGDVGPSLHCRRLLPKQSFPHISSVWAQTKAVCIIPTSLHIHTIITAASAKRCRPHRKSCYSPPRPMNSLSDRLSRHTEVTGSI